MNARAHAQLRQLNAILPDTLRAKDRLTLALAALGLSTESPAAAELQTIATRLAIINQIIEDLTECLTQDE